MYQHEYLEHPDDRKKHQELLELTRTQNIPGYQCEIRLQHKNGDWFWFLEHGRIIAHDKDGAASRLSGICTNISDQKANSQSIAQLLQQKEVILSSIREGIFGVDVQGKITFANPAAVKMFGWEQHQMIGQMLHHCSSNPQQACKHECPICICLVDGEIKRIDEEIFWRRDGSSFPVQYTCTPVSEHDKIVAAVISFRDISEFQQAQQKISFLATHDALTGLPNRAFFMDNFNQTLSNAPSQPYMLALLFIDLDRFKSINDKLGHEAGDIVLIQSAKRIQESIRKTDSVARLGSDEFVVILDNIGDSQSASEVADKILSQLTQPIAIGEQSIHIGASIGISLYPLHSKEASELLRVADQAMYHVKHSGKGQYYLAAKN